MSESVAVAVHLANGPHEPKTFPDLYAHMMCDHGPVGPHEFDNMTDSELWEEHQSEHLSVEFDRLAKAQGYFKPDGVDVRALDRAWRYGVHCQDRAERDEAWEVVALQINRLLVVLLADSEGSNG